MFFYGRVSVIQMTSHNSLKILFSPSFFANFKGSRNYETASNQIRTSLMKYGSKEAAFSIQRSSLTKGLIALENNPFLQVSNPNIRWPTSATAKLTFPRQNLLFHGKTYFSIPSFQSVSAYAFPRRRSGNFQQSNMADGEEDYVWVIHALFKSMSVCNSRQTLSLV